MEKKLTADQMFDYFQAGAIGTKEFRSFLAQYDSRFESVRDPDVDNEIDANARRKRELIDSGNGFQLVDKEGQVRQPE